MEMIKYPAAFKNQNGQELLNMLNVDVKRYVTHRPCALHNLHNPLPRHWAWRGRDWGESRGQEGDERGREGRKRKGERSTWNICPEAPSS